MQTIMKINSNLSPSLVFQNKTGCQHGQFAPALRSDKFNVPNLTIVQATNSIRLIQVIGLMRAFVTWLRNRYQDRTWFSDGYFDEKAYENELRNLPGEYGPPTGRLLLAVYQHNPAGCVAIRKLTNISCEMKRLYVSPDFQGKKVGKILVKALIDEAKCIGYRRMVLDTGCRQIEAQNLYRSVGFKEIGPYYDMPQEVKKMLVFMELKL